MLAMAFLSVCLVALFAFFVGGGLRRDWKGQEARFFERDWEIEQKSQKLRFAIPSYKTAYFEVQPLSRLARLRRKIRRVFPTAIEQEFRFLSEDPRLAQLLSENEACLQAFRRLGELGFFRLISTGQELQGWMRFKVPSDECLQLFYEQIGVLLENQFDLPLNEMSLSEIQGWRRSSVFPHSMFLAGSTLLLIQLLAIYAFGFEVSAPLSKACVGLTIFATGMGLFWGAFRSPPHDFARVALSYLLIFSWSALVFIQSVFSFLNPWFNSPSEKMSSQGDGMTIERVSDLPPQKGP